MVGKIYVTLLAFVCFVASGFTSVKKAPFNEPELLHYWNFNETNFLEPISGSGTITFDLSEPDGAVISGTGQSFAGANARNGDATGAHLRVNFPIGTVLRFNFSTEGYQDVVVKYETRRSGQGAGTQRISYTLNGTDYTEFTTVDPPDGAPTITTLDFTAVEGSEDNPNFGLRFEFEQASGGDEGNNRFDNFTVEGTAIPQIELFHYWNFNETNFLEPNAGDGSISVPAGIQPIASNGQGFNASNARNGDAEGNHLRANTPIGTVIRFNISTVDYKDVVVKYETRRSGSGAGTQKISYTLNGTDYTVFTTIDPPDGTPAIATLDFTAIEGSEDNENFGVQIEFEEGPGSSGGNNRIDNFTVEGIFTGETVPVLTDPVVLTTPADDVTEVSLKPTLTWETLTNATAYELQVSEAEDFSTIVVEVTRSQTNFTLTSQLEANTIYFWRVRGTNSSSSGPFSEIQSFTTITTFAGFGLKVNEVMASNSSGPQDEDGDQSDWIELYNTTASAIDLSGFGLTDAAATPYKWIFPAVTIGAGEYMIIWASDKNRTVPGQPLHTNYAISADGESVVITNVEGITVDASPATPMASNISYGLLPNGTGTWTLFNSPTIGAPNQVELEPLTDVVDFSHSAGFYEDEFELTLSTAGDALIVYTIDGSEPDPLNFGGTTYQHKDKYKYFADGEDGTLSDRTFTSIEYTAPIGVVDRSTEPNGMSTLTSGYNQGVLFDWTPDEPVRKATVVKARLYKDGFAPGPVTTMTYFVGQDNPSGLPIFSLSIGEDVLFDYNNGLHVPGVDFDEWRAANPEGTATAEAGGNYKRNVRVKAYVEYFDPDTETRAMAQDVGFEVAGDFSTIQPMKSLRLYAGDEYDAPTLPIAFFKTQPGLTNFDRITLRSGGQDFQYAMMRDAVAQQTVRNLNVSFQEYRPAIVFINGEYWGLMEIREHLDEHYVRDHFGVDEDAVDLIDQLEVEEGSDDHYTAMTTYIEENHLVDDTHYEYIQTQMDVDNFTDYFISEIYSANFDWPGSNIKWWRSQNDYAPGLPAGQDGRWRWMLKDLDLGYRRPDRDLLQVATELTDVSWPNPPWSTLLLRELTANDNYKRKFITRFADLLNTTFVPERVVDIIDSMRQNIDGELQRHRARWSIWTNFEKEFGIVRDFPSARPAYQRQHIMDHFNLHATWNVTVDVSNEEHGYIHVNTIDILDAIDGVGEHPYPWTGSYFEDVPVTITAVALPGYEFSHWEGTDTPSSQTLTVSLTSNLSVKAIFTETNIVRISPAHQSVEVAVDTDFKWVEGSSNDVYVLQVATDEEFNNIIVDEHGITAEAFQPSASLEPATNYFWRLRFDAVGEEDNWTQVWTFRTPVTAPGAVTLISPNGDSDHILAPQFSWTEGTYVDTYRLQISENEDFSVLFADRSNVTATNLVLNRELPEGATYYWRVRSENSAGVSEWVSSSFTTVESVVAPLLVAPAADAINIPLLASFSWQAVEKADTYSIDVAKASDFSTVDASFTDLDQTTVTLTTSLEPSTVYYWRVRATNSVRTGDWSETRSFTTTTIDGVNDDNLAAAIVAYPNPVKDKLRLEVPGGFVMRSLHVIDGVGRSSAIPVSNEIDFSDRPAGMFYLRIGGAGGQTVTLKLMKVQ